MTAPRAFRRFSAGPEATPGTAVPTTEPLLGTLAPEEQNELNQPDEDRNSLARHYADDEFVSKGVELTWEGDVNHRHILWALLMGIRGNVTPTQPDSTNEPNAYLYTIAPSLTAANTPDQANGVDTFTFEYGDNQQAYESAYCFATQIQIEGSVNGVLRHTTTIRGRERGETTFTGGLTYSTVQRFPFNKCKFYVETAGADLGSHQKTGLLTAFTWTLDTQLRPFFAADGNLYFSSVAEDKKTVELQLTYKRGTDSESERNKYDARTTTFLRIEAWGGVEMDTGQANYPYLILDGAYRYMTWPGYGEQDGLSTEQVTASSVYDATWGKTFEVKLLTNLAAIPT